LLQIGVVAAYSLRDLLHGKPHCFQPFPDQLTHARHPLSLGPRCGIPTRFIPLDAIGIGLYNPGMGQPNLRAEVERFLNETGMPQSVFGRAALNDGNFVADLRRGRRMWPENAERVLNFIRSHRRQSERAAC